MKCKNMACVCARSRSEVIILSTTASPRGGGAALHAPCCHLNAPLALPPCLSRAFSWGTTRWWDSQMELKSRPTAVTHANCIVYGFYRWQKPAVSYCLMPSHSCFCYGVTMVSLSVTPLPLLLIFSDSHLLIPLCVFIFLKVYRHSYMASYSIYNIHTR